MSRLALWIDGEERAPAEARYEPSVCPSTERVLALQAVAGARDVDAAVRGARAAQPAWEALGGRGRAAVLRRVAGAVREARDAMAREEAADCGKPLKEAEWDMDDVAGCFDYFAGLAERLEERQGREVRVPDADFRVELHDRAAGVVAAVTPWNYPALMSAWKAAPALAAGCAVVLKPSELAPLTTLRLARLCAAAGVPAGVLQVVTGGGETGALLVAHPGCDKVAFTGSVPTGVRVGEVAVRRLVPVTLELGGKSPVVVFDDADLARAVEWVAFGAFWTNGQICSATSRLIVHESVAPRFKRALAALAASIPLVDVTDPANDALTGAIGPLVSRAQQQKVLAHVDGAVGEGARVLAGGRAPPGRRGFFVEPTVLEVTPAMRVWRDEVFGPVLAVVTFRDEAEAVRLANDTEFGLAGAVMSRDPARCARVAGALRCGVAWINCSQPCFVEAPWGGCKRSGIGRELGERGLDNYLEPKQVVTHVADKPLGWYAMDAAEANL